MTYPLIAACSPLVIGVFVAVVLLVIWLLARTDSRARHYMLGPEKND